MTSLINEKVTSLRESVSEDLMEYKNQTASDLQFNTQQLCAKMDTLDMKMVSVNASMREELRVMESKLEEYKQQTASELAGLQSSVMLELAALQNDITSELHTTCQSNNTEHLTQLSTTINTLHSNLITELEQTILSNLTLQLHKTHDYLAQNLCAPVSTSSLLSTTHIPYPSPTNCLSTYPTGSPTV